MRAELYRPDETDRVVAVARWSDSGATIDAEDPPVDGLDRLFRPTPVVVSDPSLLPRGTHGETMLQPGTLPWVRAALLSRSSALGLAVRFVAEDVRNGWDPAANYRTFAEQAKRLASS
jgi:hypothetical protein